MRIGDALILIVLFSASIFGCSSKSETAEVAQDSVTGYVDTLRYEQEKHLKNLRQLTFGGDNAEAYWSFDNTKLTFQSNNKAWDLQCDQIFLYAGGRK